MEKTKVIDEITKEVVDTTVPQVTNNTGSTASKVVAVGVTTVVVLAVAAGIKGIVTLCAKRKAKKDTVEGECTEVEDETDEDVDDDSEEEID
jgi:hypothetical protein